MKQWDELKAEIGNSPEARKGYEQARAAYEFGRRVRELRKHRGWSQAELARRLGTTQSAIARMEAGGADPRLSTVQNLSAVFEVSFTLGASGVAAGS